MGSVYSAGAAFFTSERTRDGPGLFPVRILRDLSAFTFLLRHDGWSPPTDVWDQGGSALSPEVCFSARHMGSIYLLSISVMGRMNLRCWGSLEIISAFSPFLAFTRSVCGISQYTLYWNDLLCKIGSTAPCWANMNTCTNVQIAFGFYFSIMLVT